MDVLVPCDVCGAEVETLIHSFQAIGRPVRRVRAPLYFAAGPEHNVVAAFCSPECSLRWRDSAQGTGAVAGGSFVAPVGDRAASWRCGALRHSDDA